ncbi:MAG: hypothetical protein MRY78_19575 [Saprospiraceae bacterium]|nr:hypothetical protein [Saprospiraceae bacterium]
MKRAFMIEFELPEVLTEDFLELVPEQRDMVNRMLAEGQLKSYSLSLDRSTLWAVMAATSEFEVMELIAQMPLCDYMTPHISELMFHNGAEAVSQFSLN